jgi:hypothetical protein
MAYYPGTYITTGVAGSSNYNDLVDNYLTPRLLTFRQIIINDEPAVLKPDKVTWKTTYGNWNQGSDLFVRKNGTVISSAGVTNIDYSHGCFRANPVDVGLDGKSSDTVEVTYEWDYFPVIVLKNFLMQSVQIVNTSAWGSATSYEIDTMPGYWKGVVTDLAFALAIERILLDYDLWKWRLVYAIGPGDVESSGGDIVGQLQTLKQNAEERAYRTLENEKFKMGNRVSVPTVHYYDSVRGMGTSAGRHGIPFVGGRLRGWTPNRIM